MWWRVRFAAILSVLALLLAGPLASPASAQGYESYGVWPFAIFEAPPPPGYVPGWRYRRYPSPYGAERVTARGPVDVHVSIGSQVMTVSMDGEVVYRWPISTGRIGYNTPHGTYHPERLAEMWRSRKYHMAPMPHSIFFRGGYAIHGTYETAYLGSRASHGCIRLSPRNAALLYSLVRSAGFGRTRITISG